MVRTTVMAEEIVMERLKALAAERGVSLSMLVREALAEKADEYRPRPSLGIGASGSSSLGTDASRGRIPPR
ncbi:MAG: CopG family transcriptional regulator [Actinomycetota bacterium]